MNANKLLVTASAAAAFSLVGFSAERLAYEPSVSAEQPVMAPPALETWHVGKDEDVPVKVEAVQHYVNADIVLPAGDKCFIMREAELIIGNGAVFYKHPDALGTECPDGSQLNMTPTEVYAQNRKYKKYEDRKSLVTNEIKSMSTANGVPVVNLKQTQHWVTLANPEPITQHFSNDDELISYGDDCLLQSTVSRIGQLSTGESVMVVTGETGQLGTTCPNGTIFVQ